MFGRQKFRTPKNFGRIDFRTLFWSEIKSVRNLSNLMYVARGPRYSAWLLQHLLWPFSPGGELSLSLGRGVPPGPWNPDPVYNKKFVKIWKIDTLLMIFRSNSTHFSSKCVIFRPCVYKIFKNLRSCLWADGRKIIPWRAARPRIAYAWEYPPPRSFNFWSA